jgi:hypothetical protein
MKRVIDFSLDIFYIEVINNLKRRLLDVSMEFCKRSHEI